jgi:hypothetical protein
VTVNCLRLGATQTGNTLTINWTGGRFLQKASSITGPWITISNAVSPYDISVSGNRGFFRVVQ